MKKIKIFLLLILLSICSTQVFAMKKHEKSTLVKFKKKRTRKYCRDCGGKLSNKAKSEKTKRCARCYRKFLKKLYQEDSDYEGSNATFDKAGEYLTREYATINFDE